VAAVILEDLVRIQKAGGLEYDLKLLPNVPIQRVRLVLSVAFITGDAKGSNALCGMYNGSKANKISRGCDCSFLNADNPNIQCTPITIAEVKSAMNDPDKQKLISHHGIKNAFHDLDFGAETIRGVHYCTPVDCMHQTRLGLAKYILLGFFATMTVQGLWRTDRALKAIARVMRQSGRIRYPRSDFTKGFTNLKLMTAQEYIGGLFCLSLLFATQFGRTMFKKYCKVEETGSLQKFRKAFQYLLVFDAWSRGHTFWALEDNTGVGVAKKAVRGLLTTIKDAYPRYDIATGEDIGHGLKISKYHETLHIPEPIHSFGSPANFGTESGEFHHKEQAKKPAAHAQKNHTTFTLQAGLRLFEDGVIRRLVQESGIDFSDLGTCLLKILGNYVPPTPSVPPPIVIDSEDNNDDDDDDDSVVSNESDDGFETEDMFVSDQASKFCLISNEKIEKQPFFVLLQQGRLSKIQFKEGTEVPFGLAAFVQEKLYEGSDPKGRLLPKAKYKDLTLLSEYVKELGTVSNRVCYLYRAHFSYRSTGPWFDWVWAVAQNKRYPVRVYCFFRYTDVITRKAKAYAIVQGGDPQKDLIPKNNKTSALTKDFEIKGRKGKRSRGQGSKTCTYPRYRIIPCADLQETCCVIPNLKDNHDPLLADPSAYEQFLLVADYEEWQGMFIKFKMSERV
jgi:ribosomal protein S18